LVGWGFTFTVAVLLLILSDSKPYQILELKALDLRFNLRGSRPTDVDLLHIDIDDESLDKLGRWPWPRSYHAKLIDILAECGAKKVLMDILFTERLKDNPEDDVAFAKAQSRSGIVYLPFYFLEDKQPPPPELKELLDKDITVSVEDAQTELNAGDDLLQDILPLAKKYVMDEAVRGLVRKNPDIKEDDLISAIEESKEWYLFAEEEAYIRGNLESYKLARFFVNKFAIDYQKQGFLKLKEYNRLSAPIREYIESIKGTGYINADPDQDGVMRRVPLFIKYEDRMFAQVGVSVLLAELNVNDIDIKSDSITLKNARFLNNIEDIEIPVDDEGCMLVNWTGMWGESFKHIPYYKILQLYELREQLRSKTGTANASGDKSIKNKGEIAYLKSSEEELKRQLTAIVKDKICLVGLTATGTQDMGPIPLQSNYPLVGVTSNLINTIMTGKFIRKAKLPLNAFICLVTALVIGFGSLLRLWRSLLLSVCYAIGYFLAAFFIFDKSGLWVDLVGPFGVVIFGFTGIMSFRYFTEEREKLWIKQAFSFYLSGEVISELMNDPSKLKLGGEKKNLTVLFADVRGFTRFSESHQPEEIVAMLNEILDELVNVVFKYNGTLDKFVGDELMAFFGAPGDFHKDDHAIVCVRTSIEMQEKLRQLQDKWSTEQKESLHIGIGINTGDMVVGNMGSSKRMDYTVIGDNVNLAARLCSAAGADKIIISEQTYEQVREHVKVEKLEPISVKGKAKPIQIYEVIGLLGK